MITQPPDRLVHLLDSMTMIVCGLDRSGHIVAANDRCRRLTGLDGALIGRDWREIFASAERHDQVTSLWASVTPEGGTGEFEALCRTGRRLRWQFSRWRGGDDGALCAVAVDVTDERDRLARRRAVERVTALANLGAGLAHELRNPLNSASLQLTLAERKLARAGAAAAGAGDPIGQAMREIDRAAALLDDFLAFARPEPLAIARVELGGVVARAIARVRARAQAHGVELVVGAGPAMAAEADGARLEGALVQLLTNAIDASVGIADEVTVSWTCAGNALSLEVADRGAGLPSESAPIFDPFFTTKPGGTGLGLAIVERVAHDHGGSVEVERTGGTTVFRLRLPIIVGVL